MAETTDSRDLDLSDLAHHVVPMAPQITPSGDQVVVMVRRADLAENRYVNELVLVELESRSTACSLTSDRRCATRVGRPAAIVSRFSPPIASERTRCSS